MLQHHRHFQLFATSRNRKWQRCETIIRSGHFGTFQASATWISSGKNEVAYNFMPLATSPVLTPIDVHALGMWHQHLICIKHLTRNDVFARNFGYVTAMHRLVCVIGCIAFGCVIHLPRGVWSRDRLPVILCLCYFVPVVTLLPEGKEQLSWLELAKNWASWGQAKEGCHISLLRRQLYK